RQFYPYDKAMSIAKFKKDYWNVTIRGKLESLQSDLSHGSRSDDFNKKLLLVRNEFIKEGQIAETFRFGNIDELTPEKVTPDVINSALKHVDMLRKSYVDYSNRAKDAKDVLVTKLSNQDKEGFLKLRDNYANKSLEEFVTNKNETLKEIEYNNEIVQKLDPIYMDPKHPLIRSHFYSPEKMIFGKKIDTFIVNVIVLWVMTIMLYLVLYFRLLKKTLDSGEMIMGKPKKGN
ncbi:MAG TPA: hypothetical protein VHO68_12580, partial [Bacteroidales bacterium]|nr:hypothetical protein [Bacteroidales bacterium]